MIRYIKNLRIRTKLWSLTTLLLISILIVSGCAVFFIGEILNKSHELSVEAGYNEKILGIEIGHLEWVNDIESLFAENKERLEVQTDHTQCAMGMFLNSEDASALSGISSRGDKILKKIVPVHQALHESAAGIKGVWAQTHPGLAMELEQILVGHLKWMQALSLAIMGDSEINVETDPRACALGRWLESGKTKAMIGKWPGFAALIRQIKPIHTALHESALKVDRAFGLEEKIKIFNQEVVPEYQGLEKLFTKIISLEADLEQRQEKAKEIFSSDTAPALASTLSLFEDLKAVVNEHELGLEKEMAHNGELAKNVFGIVVLAALILGCLASFFIIRMITGPLNRTVELTDRMAQGDFSTTLEIDQADEIGQVVKSVNAMSTALKTVLTDITTGVQTLNSSSADLTSVSKQITENSTGTSERSSSVASAAEEMSMTMNNVAAASEQASANIQGIVAAIEQMSATATDIAGNMAKGSQTTSVAVEKSKYVSNRIDELNRVAVEINTVTEAIADISEQTNLLALNATIEAARAGEAGKGFAVVASEIKALASQTAGATNEIALKINDVQEATQSSVSAISSVTGIIDEINAIISSIASAVEEQSATTREVSDNVSQAAQGIEEVNENVNQTSGVIAEVAQDIQQVSQAADEVSCGSGRVNASALELSGLANRFNEMTAQFKLA